MLTKRVADDKIVIEYFLGITKCQDLNSADTRQ